MKNMELMKGYKFRCFQIGNKKRGFETDTTGLSAKDFYPFEPFFVKGHALFPPRSNGFRA